MRIGRARSALFAVALVGTALTALAGPAQAAHVRCGAVITKSTTLDSDVGPCPGDGLVVTASNIVLDLGGHRLFGTAAQGEFAGVRLRGVSGVSVRRGSIDHFDAGVVIGRGGANTVDGLTVRENISNQYVADHPGASLGDGIVLFSSSNNRIQGNIVDHNGPFSGISVVTDVNEDNVIVGPVPTGNVISRNIVSNNNLDDVCPTGGADIFLGHCDTGESIFNESIGIRIEGPSASRNTLSYNYVFNSGRDGVSVINAPRNPQPVENVISYNTLRHNGWANIPAFIPAFGPESANQGGAGYFDRCFVGFSDPASCPLRTKIVNNTATDNGGDGIEVGGRDATITGNVAYRNAAVQPLYYRAYDARDDNPDCDNNTWRSNRFGTVNQPCVLGHTGTPAASSAQAQSAGVAAETRQTPSGPKHLRRATL